MGRENELGSLLVESARAAFEVVRRVAAGDLAPSEVTIGESDAIGAELAEGAVAITRGLLDDLCRRSRELLPPPERPLFRARVLAIVFARAFAADAGGAPAAREARAAELFGASELGSIDGLNEPIAAIERRAADRYWSLDPDRGKPAQ